MLPILFPDSWFTAENLEFPRPDLYTLSMTNHGFFRVGAGTPTCTVADCRANVRAMVALAQEAVTCDIELLVFPELGITGYTCGDLFLQAELQQAAGEAVRSFARQTENLPLTCIVGVPVAWKNCRYNTAAVISQGHLHGIVPKSHIPTYGEFYEWRHFAPAPAETVTLPAGYLTDDAVIMSTRLLFMDRHQPELCLGVEICEDLWVPQPPSSEHALAGATILANLSASNEIIAKADYRKGLVTSQSGRCVSAYIYAAAGPGESSTDMVFSGHNLIAENGSILAQSKHFNTGLIYTDIDLERLTQERRRLTSFTNAAGQEYTTIQLNLSHHAPTRPLARRVDPQPFVPPNRGDLVQRCEEVLALQTAGLVKRLAHTDCRAAVIGLSGGLDSTLAFLVTVRAFDRLGWPRQGVQAVTMPGPGTTDRTRSNAVALAEILGVTRRTIPIQAAVDQHFQDIQHDPSCHDVTYENVQARERTQLLMDLANQAGGLVIGTGDLSELALGWATYNGDHMSMYAVNSSVPKTLVRHLVQYCADHPQNFTASEMSARCTDVLTSILATPVSPELLPPENGKISQKTEHIVGPYELHDFFLYYLTRWGFGPTKILYLAQQAFAQPTERTRHWNRTEILKWMKVFYRRFFSQQFKRSCLPDGPKVGSVTLSPRADWRMPSDASVATWLTQIEQLEEESQA